MTSVGALSNRSESARDAPWLPEELPPDWDVAPLKSFVTGAKNGLWGNAPEESDDTLFCARVADFDRTRAVLDLGGEPTVRSVPPRKRVGRLLRPGDLLLEKSGGGEKQPVGFVVLVESLPGDTICSNFVARMPVAEGADPRFVRYLHQHYYSRRINTRSIKQSTGIQNLDAQSYLQELAPRPPLPVQQAIASFLDRETSRTDTLIEKKRRLLDLLEEKRTALITWAVTRGLDPDAPMKDSGVEWIGEIPVHWEVAKIKHVARLESGHTPDRKIAEYWDGGVAWVSLADSKRLKIEDVITETEYEISTEGLRNSSARLLPKNSVAFSRDATVGLCALLGKEMAVSQHFIAWVCSDRIRPEYLLLVLKSMTQELNRLTMGATIRTLGLPEVGTLRTPLPPVEVQEAIIEHCTGEMLRIARFSQQAREALSVLQEYRSSMISAAVTGRVDVRELMPA